MSQTTQIIDRFEWKQERVRPTVLHAFWRAGGRSTRACALIDGHYEVLRPGQELGQRSSQPMSPVVEEHEAGLMAHTEATQKPSTRSPLDGLHRDLDVAAALGMKDPHKIRRLIREMLKTGAFHVPLDGRNMAGPSVLCLAEELPMPKGGFKTATAYYLNEEAQNLLALRVNTSKAKDLRTEVHKRAAQTQPHQVVDMNMMAAACATACATALTTAMTPLITLILDRLAPAVVRRDHPSVRG